jgi:BirA family biotin operon repressor/biotin-[acetyl-CoA-carboxylase] ligase
VLAEEQTEGRGRLGRDWVSPAGGNIYVSLLLQPSPAQAEQLAMTTPLAVCRAVEETSGLVAHIKWPNDVLLNGRKVCGILIESAYEGERLAYVVAGIGVNVNFDPTPFEDIRETATSLSRELGRDVSREELLASLLNHFEALYLSPGEAVFAGWKKRLETLGRPVRAQLPDRIEEGIAEDVDRQGRLIIRQGDGATVVVSAGDVTPASS